VREIEIEGFKKAYFCQTCYPKAMKVIEMIQENEEVTFEEAKVLFGKLQVKLKTDKTWGKRIIRQAQER